MPVQLSTPGVYIVEKNAFPNSVVEVATGIPVFVGYTEKAAHGNDKLTGVPARISSMMEFTDTFGGPDKPNVKIGSGDPPTVEIENDGKFLLYPSMRLFFDNGGGDCWVVSVGDYSDSPSAAELAAPFEPNTGSLEKIPEPSIVCIPEATKLPSEDWASTMNTALEHCGRMQNRVVIIDVFDGDKARNNDPASDVISGSDAGLRSKITADHPSYSAAYYPWLNTSIFDLSDITVDRFDADSRKVLADLLKSEAKTTGNTKLASLASGLSPADKTPDDRKTESKAASDDSGKQDDDAETVPEITPEQAHQAALQLSPSYRGLMDEALRQINLLPSSAAMAGVYARTDSTIGVFKAPANTGVTSVVSPAVDIPHDEQEDLNVPLDGKAVNAIRTFLGRGVLVWGARTLDGNSQDWRYINVRRTLIMLEQSIKYAIEAYVFAPNNAGTWVTVKNMISNFLDNQWKAGALAGSSPSDAYSVDVGLGSTMTANDILEGNMNVVVKVAVVRPAEFIVITIQQKMQES